MTPEQQVVSGRERRTLQFGGHVRNCPGQMVIAQAEIGRRSGAVRKATRYRHAGGLSGRLASLGAARRLRGRGVAFREPRIVVRITGVRPVDEFDQVAPAVRIGVGMRGVAAQLEFQFVLQAVTIAVFRRRHRRVRLSGGGRGKEEQQEEGQA